MLWDRDERSTVVALIFINEHSFGTGVDGGMGLISRLCNVAWCAVRRGRKFHHTSSMRYVNMRGPHMYIGWWCKLKV